MANPNLIKSSYLIDVVKHRWHYLTISIVMLIPCILAMLYLMFTQPNHSPVKLGIDFTGGTILQYGIENSVTPEQISKIRTELESNGINNPIIQNLSDTSGNVICQNSRIPVAPSKCADSTISWLMPLIPLLYINTDAPKLIQIL